MAVQRNICGKYSHIYICDIYAKFKFKKLCKKIDFLKIASGYNLLIAHNLISKKN